MNKLMALVLCCLVAASAVYAEVVTIAEGQTVTVAQGEVIPADRVYDIAAGGTLDLNNTEQTFAGLTGKGAVVNAKLTLTLAGGPYVFAGTMAGTLTFAKSDDVSLDEFHFVVGGAETLAAVTYTSANVEATPIWFAPGVGRFKFLMIVPSAKERFTTEDVNGDPIAVSTQLPEGPNSSWRVIGSGDFHTENRFGGGGINYTIFSEATGRMGPNTLSHQNFSNLDKMTLLEGVTVGGLGGISGQFNYNLGNTTFPWCLYGGAASGSTCCNVVFDASTGEIVVPARQMRMNPVYSVVQYKGAVRFKDGLFYNFADGRSLMCAAAGSDLIFDHAALGPDQWPYSMRYDGAAGTANIRSVVLTNGSWYGINSILPTNYVITTGSRFYSCGGSSTATAANPGVFFVDGANLDVFATAQGSRTVVPDVFEVHVGPRGAGFDGFQYASYPQTAPGNLVDGLVRTAPGCTADGGVTTSGAGVWQFKRPLDIVGPFCLKDGFVTIPSGYTGDASSLPFGPGDFTFGSGVLSDGSAQTAIALASGSGAKLLIDGAAELVMTLGDTWTVGPSDATSSSLVRTPGLGGILVLSEAGGLNTTVPVVVNGGVETTAAGLPKVPVLLRTSHATGVGVGGPGFAEYVPGEGFRAFANVVEYIDGCTPTSVASPYSFTLAEDKTIAALNMRGQTATLSAGATLTVGDGENPAVVLLTAGNNSDALITGEGTLDFGTSEGVFVAPVPRSRGSHATVAATIAGSAGVSYHGVYAGTGNGFWEAVNISGTNTYSGGTRLCGICAYAKSPKAFSDGTVTLDGGQLRGSRLILAAEGLVISNKVVASGCGGPHYNGMGSTPPGAINFPGNAELAGDLRCAGRTWIGTYEDPNAAYHEGVLSGVVSGESAVILEGSGAIVMTNTNTVRHTEVYGKLILRGNAVRPCVEELIFGSTGNGVLRIENTEPLTITSRIVGKGTIELAGSAPVTFTDAYTFRGRIDICGGDREVTGLGDHLTDVVNTTTGTTGLLTLDGKMRLGAVAVGEGVGLAAGGNGGLNFEGSAQTVPSVGGSGRIFGAPLTVTGEIQPGGVGGIGMLTLAAPTTFGSDVKLVTEVGEAGVDKLEVVGDIDRAQLALEVVRLGRPVKSSGPYLEAVGGELTGTYKSVVKPMRGVMGFSTVGNADWLTYSVPGLLLFVR